MCASLHTELVFFHRKHGVQTSVLSSVFRRFPYCKTLRKQSFWDNLVTESDVSQYYMINLKRWLELRGLTTKGNKTNLFFLKCVLRLVASQVELVDFVFAGAASSSTYRGT